MKHKCRVYKDYNNWITQCLIYGCYNNRAYFECTTWEEAMLEALHHRMRNL